MFELVVYGLVAALSPLAFAATLAALESGRAKALAFALGFVTAQLASCAVLVALGSAALPERHRSHPTLRALVELAFGAALLWLAVLLRRRPEQATRRTSARSLEVLDRLRRMRGPTVLGAGLLLGIGGPKRLVLTALAAGVIADSNGGARAVAGYGALATVLVWAPVAAYLLAGHRALALLGALNRSIGRRQRGIAFVLLSVIGAFAVVGALAELLT